MNVFTYWTDISNPLIEILRQLMRLHSCNGRNYRFYCIDRDAFINYFQDIPRGFDSFSPSKQADIVRVWALCEFGGIWLDADTLVLDSLSSLIKIFDHKHGFFII